MGKKLYVGNLAYSVRDNDLEQAFGEFGAIVSAKVMMERDTGRSKGFGFVEMGSDAEALAAVEAMNGHSLQGRALTVNEAVRWKLVLPAPAVVAATAAALVVAAATVVVVAAVAGAAATAARAVAVVVAAATSARAAVGRAAAAGKPPTSA